MHRDKGPCFNNDLSLQVVTALIDKMVVPRENTALFTATKDPDSCTYRGMKASFQDAAKRVGEDGLFVFHFTGHGLKVLAGEWGLAPSDFDFTDGTFITSPVLNQWLHDSGCKARYVLFTLDCCYAGGIGNDLTAGVTNLRSGLYVLSACTAFETSLVVGPLGQSLFAYFLAYAIRRVRFPHGALPISAIFDECGTLCTALSSLFMSYRGDHIGLKPGTMKPELQFFDPSTRQDLERHVKAWLDDTMVYSPVEPSPHHPTTNKFKFVMKYYKRYSERGRKRNELSDLCMNWLIHISESQSPLNEFASRGLLNNEILSAVMCAILWSIASIQVAADDLESVVDPNMFLVGFLHAAAALDSFHSSQITLKHLEEAWQFYQTVAVRNELNDAELAELHKEIERDLETKNLRELRQLQPIMRHESQTPPPSLTMSKEDGSTRGALANTTSNGSSQLEDDGKHTSHWTVDIPELSAFTSSNASEHVDSALVSIWPQTRPGCIMPSMKMETIRPMLTEQCKLNPSHLENEDVVADSIVLHVLEVSEDDVT